MMSWRHVLISKKLQGYLGILRKGDYLVIGADRLKEYNKKLYLVIIPKNASKNILKVSTHIANDYNIPVIEVPLEDMGECIGLNSCQILGVKNKGLSDAILNNCKDEYKIIRGV